MEVARTIVMDKDKYQVFDLAQKSIWKEYLNNLPEKLQDIYFTPEYYELYENDSVKPECFIYQENNNILLYPYLKTHINSVIKFTLEAEYYDIEGAYGYNGFIANTKDGGFLDRFADTFQDFCKKNNVIAEFTRFNPLLNNHTLARHMDITIENKNIVVDLTKTEDEIWRNSYEHAARKNIAKANRSGLTVKSFMGCEIEREWLNKFMNIYFLTMDRNKAENFYYFRDSYFSDICNSLGNNSIFIFSLLDSTVVSCELVLFGKTNAYSFLGGTLSEYYPLRPNNLLKHELIRKLKNLGLSNYCLGGGSKPGDGIYRYKKTFSKKEIIDFYIGKRVYNERVYDSICNNWKERFPKKEKQYRTYLLKYKY